MKLIVSCDLVYLTAFVFVSFTCGTVPLHDWKLQINRFKASAVTAAVTDNSEIKAFLQKNTHCCCNGLRKCVIKERLEKKKKKYVYQVSWLSQVKKTSSCWMKIEKFARGARRSTLSRSSELCRSDQVERDLYMNMQLLQTWTISELRSTIH